MKLSDLRLKFARDLIGHWLDIRGGALVPLDQDIDPRQLQCCFDYVGIADLAEPAQVIVELAGTGLSRRFGRDIHHVNWVDLVPPMLGDAGVRARERVRSLPCGYYHKFTGARDGAPAVTAAALALPLRERIGAVPDAVIVISCNVGQGTGDPPAGWLTPSARVEHFFAELVDIGAGVSTED